MTSNSWAAHRCRFEIIFFFSALSQMLVDQVRIPFIMRLAGSVIPSGVSPSVYLLTDLACRAASKCEFYSSVWFTLLHCACAYISYAARIP